MHSCSKYVDVYFTSVPTGKYDASFLLAYYQANGK